MAAGAALVSQVKLNEDAVAPDERAYEYVSDVQLSDIQRARLLAAITDIVAERGLSAASVMRVTARAGVSRRTFYELFENRDQCFLEALDDAVERSAAVVVPAYRSGKSWLEQVRAAVAALLAFLDGDQPCGSLLVLGSLSGGVAALDRRRVLLERLAAGLDEGRSQSPRARELPPLTAESVVGGALAIVHARMLAGERPLSTLQGQLMSILVMPYMGAAAARRELERPMPALPTVRQRVSGEALRDLGIRLTYRTARVLIHLSEHPDESNRGAALAAGISDQGQISRLLSRLQRLGLVENVGGPAGTGVPNAWRLTGKGREVQGGMGLK